MTSMNDEEMLETLKKTYLIIKEVQNGLDDSASIFLNLTEARGQISMVMLDLVERIDPEDDLQTTIRAQIIINVDDENE